MSLLPERYGSDVLFRSKGGWYGIQRKEMTDLIASVQDGRLAKEVGQMKQLVQGVLVVEGTPRWTLDGEYVGKGFGSRWTRAQHTGLLLSVQAGGVWVSTTANLAETIHAVESIVAWTRKEQHQSLARRPGPTSMWGRPDNRDFARHVVMGLPSVGPALADRILDRFGVPFGWKVTEEQLTEVEGIGKKKARQLWLTLEKP